MEQEPVSYYRNDLQNNALFDKRVAIVVGFWVLYLLGGLTAFIFAFLLVFITFNSPLYMLIFLVAPAFLLSTIWGLAAIFKRRKQKKLESRGETIDPVYPESEEFDNRILPSRTTDFAAHLALSGITFVYIILLLKDVFFAPRGLGFIFPSPYIAAVGAMLIFYTLCVFYLFPVSRNRKYWHKRAWETFRKRENSMSRASSIVFLSHRVLLGFAALLVLLMLPKSVFVFEPDDIASRYQDIEKSGITEVFDLERPTERAWVGYVSEIGPILGARYSPPVALTASSHDSEQSSVPRAFRFYCQEKDGDFSYDDYTNTYLCDFALSSRQGLSLILTGIGDGTGYDLISSREYGLQ